MPPWFGKSDPPDWAVALIQSVQGLHRKVNLIMAVDTKVVARLVAGAEAVAQESKRVAAERDAYKALAEENGATAEDLKAKLAEERAAEAEEDRQDAASTADINAAADAVLKLVGSAETPDVAPVPVEDVPAVVDGSQDVTAPSGGDVEEPQAADPATSDPAAEPVTGEARAVDGTDTGTVPPVATENTENPENTSNA